MPIFLRISSNFQQIKQHPQRNPNPPNNNQRKNHKPRIPLILIALNCAIPYQILFPPNFLTQTNLQQHSNNFRIHRNILINNSYKNTPSYLKLLLLNPQQHPTNPNNNPSLQQANPNLPKNPKKNQRHIPSKILYKAIKRKRQRLRLITSHRSDINYIIRKRQFNGSNTPQNKQIMVQNLKNHPLLVNTRPWYPKKEAKTLMIYNSLNQVHTPLNANIQSSQLHHKQSHNLPHLRRTLTRNTLILI